VRVVSLHPDVLVATSAVLRVNCVLVRGAAGGEGVLANSDWADAGSGRTDVGLETVRSAQAGGLGEAVGGSETIASGSGRAGETLMIDSPVLPDELGALPAIVEQARFPALSGLLATHADWDHLLGRLAFPGVALGCAENTAMRLRSSPGEAQRELRAFDEGLLIERDRPLALGSVQALPVPGRCAVGERDLELHPAAGHTGDGMAVFVPWARVLVAGDYLSAVELPMLGDAGGDLDIYLATLERLRPLVRSAEHVVPGHGPVLDRARALAVLEEDLAYVWALTGRGGEAEPPVGRRTNAQRKLHAKNVLKAAP
jgi:glyoxylase-like metal-dependent hydrolase (beta-lactamase superfamily II)